MEGKLHKELYYWVRCACGREDIPNGKNRRAASEELRTWGWRFTAAHGWRCPECAGGAGEETEG